MTTKPHPEKIIPALPKMKMHKILKLWHNVIDIIEDYKKIDQHKDGRLILSAIHDEWARRGRKPCNPENYFDWPSTEAPVGFGGILTDDWLQEGLLRYMGYQVGSTHGRSTPTRQRILAQMFDGPLPPAFPDHYMRQWGEPRSAARLQKMAESIAAFARNAKRRDSTKMWDAIRDWERDLKFLYDEYYVEHFGFAWPSTDLE